MAPAKVAAGGKLWLDVNMYFDKYNLGSNDVKGYCWVYSDMLGDTRDDGNYFYEEKGSKYLFSASPVLPY